MAVPLAAVVAFIGRVGLKAAQKRFGRAKVKQAQEMAMPGGTKAKVKGSSAKDRGGRSSQPKDTSTQMPGGTTVDPRSASMLKGSRDATRTRRHGKRKQRATQRDKQAAIGLGGAAATSLTGAAFGGKEEKEPPKPTVTGSATGAKDRSGIGGGGVRQTTRVKTTPKPDTRARATATRSQAEEARRTMSGPGARPSTPETSPRPTRSRVGGTGSPSSPKGDRRTTTADIVGEGSTGVEKARRNPRTVAEGQKRAKKRGEKVGTFIGKDARKKAAVTKEDLEKSGLSLRDYLNRERGLTRREGMKTGGAVKKAKTAKKTNTGKTAKVRGVRIAKKGFRPAKMR